jgi:hypothetical protein
MIRTDLTLVPASALPILLNRFDFPEDYQDTMQWLNNHISHCDIFGYRRLERVRKALKAAYAEWAIKRVIHLEKRLQALEQITHNSPS